MSTMTMNCDIALSLLPAYGDGELDLVQSLELERHLQSCPACTDDGSTANKVYVTLATPARKVFLTSLNLAVSDDGASTVTQAFDKTWA